MMDGFEFREGSLHVGEVAVTAIARAVGTPTYIYSADGIRAAYRRLERAFAPLKVRTHYAVKACANLQVCRLLRDLGAGMDVVSGGELERAWLAGTPMAEIAFAGVGKTDAEIRGALRGRHSPLAGSSLVEGRDLERRGAVGMFNVESSSELERIAAIAGELGERARVCIRVNPDVDARTHEYITTGRERNKFGIDLHRVPGLFDAYRDHPAVEIIGLHIHIGSLIRQVEPYVRAVGVLLGLMDELEKAGHRVRLLDLGGGWPAAYQEGECPPIEAYAEALIPLLQDRVQGGLQVVTEPGRVILANAGVLLTRVQHVKEGRAKRFVICDGGMHSLIRPAFYKAYHFVWPAEVPRHLVPRTRAEEQDLPGLVPSEVVGPICESSDFLARDRRLPPVLRGDLLAVFSAGAYGMSMASNYNDHGRPAEVLVEGDRVRVVNERQTLATMLETERRPRQVELKIPC